MYLEKKPPERIAPEHTSFLTDFLTLNFQNRQNIIEDIERALESQRIDDITNYIEAHGDEFFVFDIPMEKIPNKLNKHFDLSESPSCWIYVSRDMTYGRIVSRVDGLYENVILERDEPSAVVNLYNYAVAAQEQSNATLE